MTGESGSYRAGMVVEATVTVGDRTERRRLFRTCYTPNPWVAQQDVRDRAYYDDLDLTDVVVLFDPSDSSEQEQGR